MINHMNIIKIIKTVVKVAEVLVDVLDDGKRNHSRGHKRRRH